MDYVSIFDDDDEVRSVNHMPHDPSIQQWSLNGSTARAPGATLASIWSIMQQKGTKSSMYSCENVIIIAPKVSQSIISSGRDILMVNHYWSCV